MEEIKVCDICGDDTDGISVDAYEHEGLIYCEYCAREVFLYYCPNCEEWHNPGIPYNPFRKTDLICSKCDNKH